MKEPKRDTAIHFFPWVMNTHTDTHTLKGVSDVDGKGVSAAEHMKFLDLTTQRNHDQSP